MRRLERASRVRVKPINGDPEVKVTVIGLSKGMISFKVSIDEAELILEELDLAVADIRRRA